MENPGTGWPQAAQKAAPSGTLAPHFEQNIVPPTSRSLVAAWLRIVANPEATGQQRNPFGRHLTLLLRWPNAHVAPRLPSHLHSSDFISGSSEERLCQFISAVRRKSWRDHFWRPHSLPPVTWPAKTALGSPKPSCMSSN